LCSKPKDIAKWGIPCRKFAVPSMGSIIHLNSSSFVICPISSLKIENPGLAF